MREINRFHEGLDDLQRSMRDEVMRELIVAARKGVMSASDFHAFCQVVGATSDSLWEVRGVKLDCLPKELRFGARYFARDVYAAEVSWAVYTTEYIDSLARLLEGKKVLEVASGRGVIQPIMRERGIEWVSTDAAPPSGEDHVIQMNAEQAIEAYPDVDVVFASWLPYGAQWDIKLLRKLPLIIVGESGGGMTGGDDFWEMVEHLKTFEPAERFEWFTDVSQWRGIHDVTTVIGDWT